MKLIHCLLTLSFLSIVSLGYSQYLYEFTIDSNQNSSQKEVLTRTTEEMSYNYRYFRDSIYIISSDNDYSKSYFSDLLSDLNYSLTYFSKDKITKNTSDAFHDKACCDVTLDMVDSYGDGWDGGYLTITIDGSSTNYAASGSGTSVNVPYCDGQVLEIEYTSGSWEGENSYSISTPAGTLVSDGPTPSTGLAFYSTNACSSTELSPSPQDCEGAQMVCSNSSFSGNSSGSGIYDELTSTNDGCLVGENQSSWYYINVATSGTLAMDITPVNGTDDYDFAMWGPFDKNTANANCSPITSPVRCNYVAYPQDWWTGCGTNTNPTGLAIDNTLPTSNDDCTNNSHVRHLDVNVGEVYIMVIDNYSGSSESFDLNWSGTADLACITVPLPVELLDFSVSNQEVYNILEWSTASEKNNDYFILDYSTDGKNWNSFEEIDGVGTTTEKQHYSTTHRDYKNGINYYRLTQVDYDGTETKHKIISVDNSKKRALLKRVNTMGQEVNEHYNGIVILYYSNGSIEKMFQK